MAPIASASSAAIKKHKPEQASRLVCGPCVLLNGLSGALNRHPRTVELVILIVAPLPAPEISEILHELDRLDPFDLLETQLVLAAKLKRRRAVR